MTLSEAQQIIEALAQGLNPITGEVLAEGGPCSEPQVIRALFLAAKALAESNLQATKPAKPTKVLPEKAGKPWMADEDQALLHEFDNGASIAELMAKHQRSRGGIASRLVRLGRISERSEVDDAAPPDQY